MTSLVTLSSNCINSSCSYGSAASIPVDSKVWSHPVVSSFSMTIGSSRHDSMISRWTARPRQPLVITEVSRTARMQIAVLVRVIGCRKRLDIFNPRVVWCLSVLIGHVKAVGSVTLSSSLRRPLRGWRRG